MKLLVFTLVMSILVHVQLPLLKAQAFDQYIGKILRDLEELYSKGVNVKPLVDQLNKVVQLYREGHTEEARKLLNKIEKRIDELKSMANGVWLRNVITKSIAVAALLSIPILTYFGLPRLYLYLWYRARRRWIVEEGKG